MWGRTGCADIWQISFPFWGDDDILYSFIGTVSLCLGFLSSAAQFCRAVASSPASGADTEPPAQKQPERKNPWNAFLSEKCRARISDLGASYASLREEYRNLTAAEYQRYEDMAEVAFCARARGLPSYAHASLPAAAAASSSSGNDVAVEALVAVPAAGHQELAVPDKAYKLVSAELEDTLDMVQKDFRRRSASVKDWCEIFHDSRVQHRQEEEHLFRECGVVEHVPGLTGLVSAELRAPADKIGEVPGLVG